jgi:SM-20-related protein
MLKVEAITSASTAAEPFCYFVTQVLDKEDVDRIRADFPVIEKPGTHTLENLKYGPAFAAIVEEMRSPAFTMAVGRQLGIGLEGLRATISVRGRAQARDGRIHTDACDKVAACLLYLNGAWDEGGGGLRILRNGRDLEDFVTEVPPHGGSFVAFKVADNSWHGHKPFTGERRCIMMNWMRPVSAHCPRYGGHKLSSKMKKLIPFFYRGK